MIKNELKDLYTLMFPRIPGHHNRTTTPDNAWDKQAFSL